MLTVNKLHSNLGALLDRLSLGRGLPGGTTHDGKRDLYEVLGYRKIVSSNDYILKYSRQDIAKRIVDCYPEATWSNPPTVSNDDDTMDQTEFELAFDVVAKNINMFHFLNRFDKLVGLGHYAVLFVGVADNIDLSQPMGRLRGPDDILYLMPFGECYANIQEYETDIANKRYGMPKTYNLQTGGYADNDRGRGGAFPSRSFVVHHTRVIHAAEGTTDNNIYGMPRLKPIFNRLDDLEKVAGGSSEIYWMNGRGGLSLNAAADAPLLDADAVKEHANDYVHQLGRVLTTKGLDVKPLDFAIKEPDKHVAVLLDLIAGATGIPKRILVGSERGELSSAQDEGNWLGRVGERRRNFCEPMMLRPLIDMFIGVGALPLVEDYEVVWEPLVSASELEKAEVATKMSAAISSYANTIGSELVIPPQQFVEDVLNLEYRPDDIASVDDDVEEDDMDEDAMPQTPPAEAEGN